MIFTRKGFKPVVSMFPMPDARRDKGKHAKELWNDPSLDSERAGVLVAARGAPLPVPRRLLQALNAGHSVSGTRLCSRAQIPRRRLDAILKTFQADNLVRGGADRWQLAVTLGKVGGNPNRAAAWPRIRRPPIDLPEPDSEPEE